MNKRISILAAVMITILTIANSLMLYQQSASAAKLSAPGAPQFINYQGRLSDAGGNPITGEREMSFRLYSQVSGGTALWSESLSVPVNNGVFDVLLGVPSVFFDGSNRYLGVTVGNDAEISPRREVVSVAYAYWAQEAGTADDADTVDGKHASEFATADDTVPSGAIILWNETSCPAGWDRVVELDGKFLVGGEVYDSAAGGSNTHTHTAPEHTHSFSGATSASSSTSSGGGGIGFGGFIAPSNHTHNFAGSTDLAGADNTGVADSRPEFATILLCQKD